MCLSPEQNDINSRDMNNGVEEKKDMRHELTDWERTSVIRLKKACDMEGIKYRHIFELAKYVIVAKSHAKDDDPDADNIRLNFALGRIRKKREWEEEVRYQEILKVHGKTAVLEEFQEASEGYLTMRYVRDKDGRRILCRHGGLPPKQFLSDETNWNKYLFVEQWAFDIAACDMEEARRGISVFVLSGDDLSMTGAYKSSKFFVNLKNKFIREQHNYRIGRIYGQSSSIFASFAKAAIKLLPKKLSQRLTVVSSVSDLDKYVDEYQKVLSPQDESRAVYNWFADSDRRYNETAEKLQLWGGERRAKTPKTLVNCKLGEGELDWVDGKIKVHFKSVRAF